MTTSTHSRVARAAGRSLALALLLVLPWSGGDSALALTLEGQAGAEMAAIEPSAQMLNPQLGQPLPLTWVEQRPDPRAATAPGASQVFGSQLNLTLNGQSSLASSVYFSKSLPLFEALRAGTLFGPAEVEPGVTALRGAGAEHVLDRGRALQQKLAYSTGALQLQGSYLDVDKDFRVPGGSGVSVVGDRSPADALAAMRGMSELQFEAKYSPTSAFALTTSRHKLLNEQPGNKEIGKSVTEAAHGLVFALGEGRQLKADYQSRDDAWRDHGDINLQKIAAHLDATSRLALDYSYDQSSNDRNGDKEKGRDVTEIKQSLAYNLTGDNKLALNYRKFDEQWAGKGPMQIETLAASLNPTGRLQLTYSRDHTANDREGHQEKGLTRDTTKRGAVYQLSGDTRLDVNYDEVREAWDRDGKLDVTDKQSRDYALHHIFSGGTKADLVRNLTSVTAGDKTTDIATTQLHLEHKPSGRLNLAADWMDRNRSDGGTEALTQLALDSTMGAGKGKTSLTGLFKQHSRGADEQQVDTLYRLGLSAAPSPFAQLNASYESFNQQGPKADHDFVRTQLALASQLGRHAKLTADYARETDKQVQTKSDRGVKLEFNPGRLSLTGGMSLRERQSEPDLTTTFADLQLKFGRPLSEWAKAVSGADPLPGAGAYGFRGTPGWAGLGDGAVALSLIDRSTDGEEHVLTRSLGYQTMVGRRTYLKLATHHNPMVKKDDKMVMQDVRLDLYEGGVDLGSGFAGLARFIREEDLKNGGAQKARVLALRGAVGGGDAFSFIGGVQKLQPEDGAATDWQFANLNLKLGRPLAEWAKGASNGGLFDDNVNYGYRKLPAWASFSDGGLSLQYMERAPEGGDKLIASAAGYQTMLGDRTYARLSFQQNPLADKGKVIPVDRKLYEMGRRFGGKFMALARYTTEESLDEAKSLRSSVLGLRGRLSERERLETVVVFDDVRSRDERNRTTTYGVQYAREVDDGHYLVIKGTFSDGGAPGGILNGPDVYQIDFAYKKTI